MVVPNPWVWRHDGTRQCGLGEEETLKEARAQLETLIGSQNVVDEEKRTLPCQLPSVCGAPTGRANVFQLTPQGFWLLFHGFAGPMGFNPWEDECPIDLKGGEVPFPFSALSRLTQTNRNYVLAGAGKGDPCCIGDLYGRRCRFYAVGDPLTDDWIPERFNVGLENARIKEIWFG